MKNVILILLAALSLCGCRSSQPGASHPIRDLIYDSKPVKIQDAQTVTNFSTVTNFVTITNQAGQTEQAAIVQPRAIVTVLPELWQTNYTVRPMIAQGIQQGANFIPIPGGGLIGTIVVGLLSAGGMWLKKEKVGKGLVQATEAYRDSIKDQLTSLQINPAVADSKAMAALRASQSASGIIIDATKFVEKYTE